MTEREHLVTPGQLVNAVAIALNVPTETVVQHDRNLVVAGLRTKGGRGHSAAKVTLLDAARLVTAVLGSVRVLDSVNTVLNCEQAMGTDEDRLIPELPQTHNFVEAMAAIIAEATTPLMFEDFDEYASRFAGFHIKVYVPRFSCLIALDRFDYGDPDSKLISYERPRDRSEPEEDTKISRDRQRLLGPFGIEQDRKIRGNSIMVLGRAFLEDGLAFKTAPEVIADLAHAGKAKPKKRNLKKVAS
jgi:hypothetical protein